MVWCLCVAAYYGTASRVALDATRRQIDRPTRGERQLKCGASSKHLRKSAQHIRGRNLPSLLL